jgi:HK97 family phage major capsid protein
MPTTPQTVTAQKIAAHVGVSWESISDWDTFTQFVQQELMRRVVDVENHELLLGDGTTGHLTGLLGASGVLTSDASTVSHPIDALERLNCVAVHRMIAGPKPDLFVTHPWTWSSIRRVKDTMGRGTWWQPTRPRMKSTESGGSARWSQRS